MSPRIAIVTSEPGRPFDDDLPPLVAAIEQLGATADVIDWDDADADWSSVDLAVIRSTWDYTQRYEEFLAWTDRCSSLTKLVNEPAVIRWNSDKLYLRDLVAAGVNVVDTMFIGPDDAIDLPNGVEFVVKPTVSAGSRDTMRYVADDHAPAIAQIEALVAARRTVMVQPYQAAVDELGETALLYFGGEFSHAVNKAPLLVAGQDSTRALFAQEIITAAEAEAGQLELAEQCLAAIAGVTALAGVAMPLPYARVDVLVDNDGRFSILELELAEPSVFFDWAPGAPLRYAKVLVELATG